MILQLEQLLRQQGAMTITAISKEMGIPSNAIHGMLELLLSKGRIATISGTSRCGGCTSCDAHQQISYVIASN